jgi:hypothetical protein
LISAAIVLTLPGILTTLIGLIILWIIVSIPVWLAGKAATAGKATFGDALLATLAGPIVYFIVSFLVDFFLCILHRFLFGGLLPRCVNRVHGICFWLHTSAHSLDLGFQSQFPNRLATSNTNSHSRMDYFRPPKHISGDTVRNSISSSFLPKNLKNVKSSTTKH